MHHTLSKDERLHGKTDIEHLLAQGHYGNVPGIRFCYAKGDNTDHPRILVSVPKKFFKRAVKRNLLKRRIREAYRLQKENMPANIDVLITYSTKQIMSFQDIYQRMTEMMCIIASNLKSDSSQNGNEQI